MDTPRTHTSRRIRRSWLHRLCLALLAVATFGATAGNDGCDKPTIVSAVPDPLELRIVMPLDGAVVPDGPNTLILAEGQEGTDLDAEEGVVFEFSLDGEQWWELPAQVVMDPEHGGWAEGVSADGFEAERLFLRARPGEDFYATRGDVIEVQLNRTPVVDLMFYFEYGSDEITGGQLVLDASGSYDPDGEIAYYRWHIRGEMVETAEPFFVVPYAALEPGETFSVEAIDWFGTPGREEFDVPREAPRDGVPARKARQCGCDSMVIRFDPAKNSIITIPGLGQPAYGPHPTNVSAIFEIDARLHGDPELCEEWQRVKRTSTVDGGVAAGGSESHKRACVGGTERATCENDSDCYPLWCQAPGGARTEIVNAHDRLACELKAGLGYTVEEERRGTCESFPLSGATLGNDDYRAQYPGDMGPKIHVPGRAVWWDAPGFREARATTTHDLKYEADFEAVLAGEDGLCRCRFHLLQEWDKDAGAWVTTPTITLDAAGSVNCTLDTGP